MKRAFVGTGLIGEAFAEAALGRGEVVDVWNRSPEKTRALVDLGASAHADVVDTVAEAEFVHIALTSDGAVDTILEKIEDALGVGAVICDHSTTSPEGTRARARRMQESGVDYLHTPIFMSPLACREAAGLILAAGPEDVFSRARSALAVMTGEVLYMGEEAGSAATMKLAGNGTILSLLTGLADVLAMARAQGIDPESAMKLFEHLDLRVMLKVRGGMMAQGDFGALWSLAMAKKDLDLMLDAGGGLELPSLERVGEILARGIAEGEGDSDVAVVGKRLHSSRELGLS